MSDVWTLFIEKGDKAKCLLCKNELYKKQGSTSSLWKHLKSKHTEEYNKIKKGEAVERQNKVNTVYFLIFFKQKLSKQKSTLMSNQK